MEESNNFNELSAETNVMDESDASSQYSGPILYSGKCIWQDSDVAIHVYIRIDVSEVLRLRRSRVRGLVVLVI